MSTTSTLPKTNPRLDGWGDIVPLAEEQYERMRALGILAADAPVELRDGYLVGIDGVLPQPCLMPAEAPRLDDGREVWPLSIDQFQRMIAAGILSEGGPIHLITGYLIAKDQGRGPGMGQGTPHSQGTSSVAQLLTVTLYPTWVVRCQLPIRLGPTGVPGAGSEPEPDAVIADGPQNRYADHHPLPGEIRLLVEVAGTSLAADRDRRQVWAAFGIPIYWIVNLIDRCLEVYSDPDTAAGVYRSTQTLSENEQVTLSWPGLAPVTFAVRDFLP